MFNQGEVDAANINLIDFLPSGLTLADTDWTGTTAGDATINIPGPLAPGASTSVDITTQVVDGSDLQNLAEISGADPVGADGEVLVLANGAVVPDVDSIADAINGEAPIDDEINNVGGDEDDHDGAILTLATTTTTNTPATSTPTTPLAVTGRTAGQIVIFGVMLIAAGAIFIVFGRNRRDEKAVAEE